MKLELTIPTNLSEISLSQYQSYLAISDPTELDIISIFCNVSKDTINGMKSRDVKSIASTIADMLSKDNKHFVNRFKLNGVEYGFIPNLDDITYGENADITKYINKWETMHQAIAVLFRPITNKKGGKYLIEKYQGSSEYSEVMKKVPLSVAFGAMVFFYNLTNELLQAIPNYLQKEMQAEKYQSMDKNGEDIQKYLNSLKATLEDLTRLQSLGFTSV